MYQKCDKKKEEVHQHLTCYCKWSATPSRIIIKNAPASAPTNISAILYLLKNS